MKEFLAQYEAMVGTPGGKRAATAHKKKKTAKKKAAKKKTAKKKTR